MERLSASHKLIKKHLVSGNMIPGEEIGIKIDQTLTQDATGTMVMLELDAMRCQRAKTEVSAQYIDHNLLQTDFKNPDDHVFLRSACQRFGLHLSPAGNGVSHPVHMELFGRPGATLLGSDSHTCAAGSMGMLAIGTGGLEVALAIMGEPFFVRMPQIFGVHLKGKLPAWVSAKDVILEMLRRHGVSGGVGKIIEYYGPGVKTLSAMDRHVIANMGAELGATTSIFPSDEETKKFLKAHGRIKDYTPLKSDLMVKYDQHDEIDLSELEPLIALPSSPGKVVLVKDVAGKEIYQAMIGSSANPGFRDFAIAATIVKGRHIHPAVSFDINPTSRQILESLVHSGHLAQLIHAGGRIHQAGCNGCIGMGQAPATDKISLRTVPRNFKGRSGTLEDQVYLCSPETAAASALTGVITDPRDLGPKAPKLTLPKKISQNKQYVVAPPKNQTKAKLIMGPNIKPLPKFEPIKELVKGAVILKVGDDISTDEILPAGTEVLPYRSNIPEIAKFTYKEIDKTFYERALNKQKEGFFIIGGDNYGQGSSREHAALAPRYLGLKCVIAKSYARIHRKNLINFGVLPLVFSHKKDYDSVDANDELEIYNIYEKMQHSAQVDVRNVTKNKHFSTQLELTDQEIGLLKAGGLINLVLKKTKSKAVNHN
ncbi:MAG: 3-isopropylmalate dehydratase large subunit [Chlamydiae bacterium]|nr:3-isopropylmalate dehydratase large subunit [Chlamydiota bacterium]